MLNSNPVTVVVTRALVDVTGMCFFTEKMRANTALQWHCLAQCLLCLTTRTCVWMVN